MQPRNLKDDAHGQDRLLQLGVRFYDTGTGRFTQRDPLLTTFSLYTYVEGRLLSAVDPSGAVTLEVWLTMEGKVPHTFICLDNECFGFYPKSTARAVANCCSTVFSLFGKCCDIGEVRDDRRRRGSPSKLLKSRELAEDEEKSLREWLNKWRTGFHMWCLIPNFPQADNCWTFAGRVWVK